MDKLEESKLILENILHYKGELETLLSQKLPFFTRQKYSRRLKRTTKVENLYRTYIKMLEEEEAGVATHSGKSIAEGVEEKVSQEAKKVEEKVSQETKEAEEIAELQKLLKERMTKIFKGEDPVFSFQHNYF